MTSAALQELSRRFGIAPIEEGGSVPEHAARAILEAFGVNVSTEDSITAALAETQDVRPPVLRAPSGEGCHVPDWLQEAPAWGISVQLYELRSQRNCGIGDFADLSDFCRIAGEAGADFVGVNPLHALFLAEPDRRSPFSPSNRLFLNPLYIAVDEVPGYEGGAERDQAAAALRAGDHIDYVAVTEHKIAILRELWQVWQAAEPDQPDYSRSAFSSFRDEGGSRLSGHALFEALSAAMVRQGHGSGWRDWPEPFRDSGGPEVRRFAEENAAEIEFHIWLQWVAQSQLEQAAEAATQAGLRIGLYLDFAVGEAPDGSATWSDPELCVPGMSVGAPPDMFTANGQDWGLSPPSPIAMKRSGFEAFRRGNEALMRDAGALRIDHAMGLWQLFFVPDGRSPADGAYVRYPVEDLLSSLTQQSKGHGAIVIGEDLGHVPPGFRDVMQAARILSYRIMYFEKDGERFIPANAYPHLALACLSTHDMPTLAGWWQGDDIALRLQHGLVEPEDAQAQSAERERDRTALLALLREERLIEAQEANAPDLPEDLAIAAHRFIARTGSMLACVRLSDLTGEILQTNLPGTVDGHPNWQLRSSVAIEDLQKTRLFRLITETMATERPKHL